MLLLILCKRRAGTDEDHRSDGTVIEGPHPPGGAPCLVVCAAQGSQYNLTHLVTSLVISYVNQPLKINNMITPLQAFAEVGVAPIVHLPTIIQPSVS